MAFMNSDGYEEAAGNDHHLCQYGTTQITQRVIMQRMQQTMPRHDHKTLFS